MKKKDGKKPGAGKVNEAVPAYETGPRWTKFATQVDPAVLAKVRLIAKSEGRQVQSLVDEALREYIDAREGMTARPHIMALYKSSVARFGPLYERLAK